MNTTARIPARAAWAATLHARLPVEAQEIVSKPNSLGLSWQQPTPRGP